MKKFILASFAIGFMLLALVGCKKDKGEKVPTTFDVVLGNEGHKGDAGTKMYLQGRKPYWEETGESIRVNEGTGTVTRDPSNYTRGRFTVSISETTDGYYAVYPASISEDYDLSETQTVKLPRTQTYETVTYSETTMENNVENTVQHTVQKLTAPMYAYNRNQPTLQFFNLCGIMAITVKNDKAWDMILDSIHVESTGYKLWGEMNVSNPTGVAEGNSKDVAIPELKAIANPTDITIPSPTMINKRWQNTVALVGIDQHLRSSKLESEGAGDASKPTEITLYVYIPSIPSGNNNFLVRVFSRPAWKNDAGSYVAENKVHISYEKIHSTANSYIGRSELVEVDMSLSDCQPVYTSLLPYSVAAGQQVCISRGNAQYYISGYSYTPEAVRSGSTSTGWWGFARRPWDFLGMKNLWNQNYIENGGTRYDQYVNVQAGTHPDSPGNHWIEHFTWDSGNQPARHLRTGSLTSTDYNECDENNDFNGSWCAWGDWGSHFTNVTTSNTWKTLTADQMHYLLLERTTVFNDNKWCFAWVELSHPAESELTFHGESKLWGIVVLPDGFKPNDIYDAETFTALGLQRNFKAYSSAGPLVVEGVGDIARRYRNDNVMTTEQFEYYEARGCVFIPCIGVMMGTGDGNDLWTENQPEGGIWTSSRHSSYDAYALMISAETENRASDCRIRNSGLIHYDAECYRKFNVRLVRDYTGFEEYKFDFFQ